MPYVMLIDVQKRKQNYFQKNGLLEVLFVV